MKSIITNAARSVSTLAQQIHLFVMDHLIAPPFCTYCKRFLFQRAVFCAVCARTIIPVVSVTCPITKSHSMKIFAIAGYQEPLKSLILAKSRSDIVASRKLGELLWSMTPIEQQPWDVVIPIPLHWTRFAKRGFNQAEEMAAVLSAKKGKPIAHLLHRAKRTPFQSSLPTGERAENVSGAFVLDTNNAELYRGKHLLLVDDLMTTGSTLQTAARELLKLKPASITAIVAARVT